MQNSQSQIERPNPNPNPNLEESCEASQIEDCSKITDKIEMMRQSIAQLSVLSKGKSLENLNRLEKDREAISSEVEHQQQKLLYEINALEQTLLQIERERMLKHANLNNIQQGIDHSLKQGEEESKEYLKAIHDKFGQYRDEIMTMKLQLVQLEGTCKERTLKFQRQCEIELINSQKKVQSLKRPAFDKQLLEFNALRKAVEQESKRRQRDTAKIASLTSELGQLISLKISQQQKRQKQGFQQAYKALEQLFHFLSEQYQIEP